METSLVQLPLEIPEPAPKKPRRPKLPAVDCVYCEHCKQIQGDMFAESFKGRCAIKLRVVPCLNTAPPKPCKHFKRAAEAEVTRRFMQS
jgi:hypothetical protein